jgi:hypothetical protein
MMYLEGIKSMSKSMVKEKSQNRSTYDNTINRNLITVNDTSIMGTI